jgi:pimeloyl-ACP methyl ester carboxylesterase
MHNRAERSTTLTEASLMTGEGKIQAEDITLSGHKIHFWRGGEGFPLLLLHSAWGDAEMSWAGVWDELSRSFTVIAPDLPGFGGSPHISRPSPHAMVKVLGELLDALDIGRAVVAGNSFGGGVARQFAADFPGKTSRIVLVNSGLMPHMPLLIRRLVTLPSLNRRLRQIMCHFSYSPQALEKSFFAPDKLPPGFFEQIHKKTSIYSTVVFDTIMNISRPLPVPDAPTFLIWGAQDRLTPLKQAKVLQKKIPGSLLISIDGAGHMPQWERPKEFVMALISAGKNAG